MSDSEARNTLTITDNRTGREYEVDVLDGNVIRAMDLRRIKVHDTDFGMMAYDPAFTNTAFTTSRITDVKGGKGILEYRGYPIEQLAGQASFLEVAHLILNGELPTREELDDFVDAVTFHTYVHENVLTILQGFRYDAHAMGMMISTVAALSTFYPEAKQVDDPENRRIQIIRLLAKMPTLAAFAFRHHKGLPYVYPENGLSYTANFLNMLFRIGGREYQPPPRPGPCPGRPFRPPRRPRAELLDDGHAGDRELAGGSLLGDGRGMGALYGPLHGGANEAVLRMLTEIGTTDNIPAFMDSVRRGERRLMGFGHRVYKAYDPRATIIKRAADEVFEVTGHSPLLDIALELEKIALQEEYFVKRNLYPNVDFYSGLIYQAMGFPVELFPVLFAIPRTVGWLAQWEEMVVDPEQKIARPRQVFRGHPRRDFVPMESR